MSIPYRFMPWTRRGLARAHANPDAAGAALATRPRITVGLTLQAKQDGAVATAVSGNVDLTLYGPADVIGIDQRLIVRTEPRPNATNFEPNYLAIVDFDPPDFPWMLTPARANATDHLRPWLVLVVVERAKVAPPALRSRPAAAVDQPDRRAGDDGAARPGGVVAVGALAGASRPSTRPTRPRRRRCRSRCSNRPSATSRACVCPRRLTPRTDYVACVVPATDGGRLRGLGQPVVAGHARRPRGRSRRPTDIELPVYFSWTFSTGPVGDIETLARRLRTPAQYGGDGPLLEQLRHIGERTVFVDGDHLLFDGPAPGPDGVRRRDGVARVHACRQQRDLCGQARGDAQQRCDERVANGSDPAAHVPTLAPPIYGEYPAKRHTVDRAEDRRRTGSTACRCSRATGSRPVGAPRSSGRTRTSSCRPRGSSSATCSRPSVRSRSRAWRATC